MLDIQEDIFVLATTYGDEIDLICVYLTRSQPHLKYVHRLFYIMHPDDRLAASLATALIALQNGASIIRVHDVKETVDVLKVWLAAR